ncbi:MAG: hypothetical protein HQL40_02355 [Alphaproteobacteria bacterium]|nr:hypothetical protein [Alphaproteobacteria bacterium]MBF0332473.1 hypothetical protein [Alphaproteobacteria bacterium]
MEDEQLTRYLQQIANLIQGVHARQVDLIERQLLLSGRQASLASSHRAALGDLTEAEFSVHSQTGEDGIIDWLVEHLPISSRRFVEFGVGDYRESNTRFLLRHRNWKGLVMEASAANVEAIRQDPISWRHDLTAGRHFLTRDSIDGLIAGYGFDGDIGILSVDTDGNDYWILEAIECARADILICEYNAVFGDLHAVSVPYVENFDRTRMHPSNLYWGASIRAFERLAAAKGYTFIGGNVAGHNAFFVRDALVGHLDIARRVAHPSLFRDSRDEAGRLTHVGGLARAGLIQHAPLIDVATGDAVTLAGLGELYSAEWLARMR